MSDFEDGAAVLEYLRRTRNWGRWGEDDERGALNLITPEKRRQAAGLVRSGRLVSLSRPYPLVPAPNNPTPATLLTKRVPRGEAGGSVVDQSTTICHSTASTHIDALCHVWDQDGMWNGRNPDQEIQPGGVRFGDVAAFSDGIVTRGVLLDVPAYRGSGYVTQDQPVTGKELVQVAHQTGVAVEPGDAVVIYSGRDRWDAQNTPWGTGSLDVAKSARPGLHVSCLRFLNDVDASVLVWDMMDLRPSGVEIAFAVHAAIWAYGIALVDNAELGPLADACRAENRWEFQLCVAPLPIDGGTGSAVNPIALL